VGHAMNDVLHEANERIKFPLRKLFINLLSPSVSDTTMHGQIVVAVCIPGPVHALY
jgi:hypothetical protein